MAFHRLIALLLILAVNLSNADDQPEFHTTRKFLKSPDSFVKLSSADWVVKSDKDTIVAAVRFRSKSHTGTILRLKATKNERDVFELVMAIKDNVLDVQLLGVDISLLMPPAENKFVFDSSGEHSIGVRINARTHALTYSVENKEEMVLDIRGDLDVTGSKLEATIGSDDRSSLVGCITLVSVTMGLPLSNVHTVSEYDTETCTHHEGECANRDCGKGTCIELETPTCDCFGTGRTGPNCKQEVPTASLKSTMDDTIGYTPVTDDQSVKRIAMKFKFEKGEDASPPEGVLISGKFTSGQVLTVYVVDGRGSIQVSPDGPAADFVFETSNKEHSILLEFDKKESMIHLTVDTDIEQIVALDCDDDSCLALTEIRYGSDSQAGDAKRIGINGCIWEAYADEKDILTMYYDGDPRIRSAAPIKQCEHVDKAYPLETDEEPAKVVKQGEGQEQVKILAPAKLVSTKGTEEEGQETETKEEEAKEEVKEEVKEEEKKEDEVKETEGNHEEHHHHVEEHKDVEQTETSKDEKEEKEETDENVKGGAILPPPIHNKKKSDRYRQPCENSVGYKCRNGATCQMNTPDDFNCKCADGFDGAFCQFSTLPRTCAEAADFFRLTNGATRIDVDASEGHTPSVVDCQNGNTIIINDMPNGTVVHDSLKQHSQFHLSYRDFPTAKMVSLIKESVKCTQHMRYDCDKAALGFSSSKTQFTVADERVLKRIGNVDQKCSGARCNCDAKEARGVDEGDLTSPDVGVQTILAYRDNNQDDQYAQMSVGPVICSGHANADKPIRFSSPAAVLLNRDFDGSHISFQFRTARASGALLSTSKGLKVEMEDQYTIAATFYTPGERVEVQSSYKLNNTLWHQIVIEVADGQIRLSVDDVTAVHTLANPVDHWGTIQLGDPGRGLVGCLRSFRLGNENLDLHQETGHVEMNELHQSCSSKCTADLCQNGAECIENLEDASAPPSCACKFPEIQHGANCQIDINVNSTISVHGGHLKYEDLERSPLTEQIVLSFRTDQQQGVLLFAHDELNNFIQLHLSSETTVALVLNNGEEVFSCTVHANPGEEYSDMQWVQVIITHSDTTGSTLSVNGKVCTIHKPRHLALVTIQRYENADYYYYIVKIPVGAHTNMNAPPVPFQYTFIGGVRDEAERKGTVVLKPRYTTELPDFLGCLRGFRVGGVVVDLRHTTRGTRPADPDLIRPGCDFGCASLQCSNGGHCGVDWENFSPAKSNLISCQCSRTSYMGETCDRDDTISLAGGHSVVVNISDFLDKYQGLGRDTDQTLKLAFKSNGQPKFKQTIATVYFSDDSIFEVLLNRNGSINVGIVRPGGPTQIRTFNGNFSDGYRHFIVAQFGYGDPIAVVIDAMRADFEYNSPAMDLMVATQVVLGTPQDKRFADAEREDFNGCVSNMEIDYGIYAMLMRPISALLKTHIERWSVTKLLPEGSTPDQLPQCGIFATPNHLPGLSQKVEFPAWDTNFARLEYRGVWTEGGEEGGSLWWIIIVVLLILLAIIIIGLIVYCMCCKNKEQGKKSPSKPRDEQEKVPLRPLVSPPRPMQPQNNFNIPMPDTNLDPADKGSFSSRATTGTEAYFTAREFQSSDEEDEWDRTLTEDNFNNKRPDDLELGPKQSFDRAMPHRMSSFRATDPTAPRDSPLYQPRTPISTHTDISPPRRSPKPVPPPRLAAMNPSNV